MYRLSDGELRDYAEYLYKAIFLIDFSLLNKIYLPNI
jgi:hypothetical protein